MRRALFMLAVSMVLSGPAAAQSPDAATAVDAGGLKEQLGELESSRAELEQLTRKLEQQRLELERQNQRAQADQNLRFVATGVALLVLCAGGIVWLRRRSKQKIDAK